MGKKVEREGKVQERENNKKRETPRADLPTEYSYIVINPFSQGGCTRITEARASYLFGYLATLDRETY